MAPLRSQQEREMRSSFAKTLQDAVGLLRDLPRRRDDIPKAYAAISRFKENHAGTPVDLLVDQPPGSPRVDYDVFIGHRDGTVAVSWRRDEGVPWSAEYTDHWAANYVVTVNERHVTVQQALLSLQYAGEVQPDLMRELVEQQLIFDAIEEHPFPVHDREVQAAADEFRMANGLLTVEQTERWLSELRLSVERFQEMLAWGIQARKLQAFITARQEEPCFRAHSQELALVQIFRVEARTRSVAHELFKAGQKDGLLSATGELTRSRGSDQITGSLAWRRMCDLPPGLGHASIGTVVGPRRDGSRYWVAEVLGKHEPQLDAETREVIRASLFQQWLADRRHKAQVRWHWM
jgi:putative peptide maturation system protein